MAVEIIGTFGKKYKIVRRTPTTPDASRPTSVVMETQEWDIDAVLTGFTEEQIKFLNVLRDDMQAIIAWNPNLPEDLHPGDLFMDGTREYTIVPPQTNITVSGNVVAWQVLVRR